MNREIKETEVSTIQIDSIGAYLMKLNKVDSDYFIETVSRLSCHTDMSQFSAEQLIHIYNTFKLHNIKAERFSVFCNLIHGNSSCDYGLRNLEDIETFIKQLKRVMNCIFTYKNIELQNIGRYVQCAYGNTLTEKMKYIADNAN